MTNAPKKNWLPPKLVPIGVAGGTGGIATGTLHSATENATGSGGTAGGKITMSRESTPGPGGTFGPGIGAS